MFWIDVVLLLEMTNCCESAYLTRWRSSSGAVSDCCQKVSCTKPSSALFSTKSAALHLTSAAAQGGLLTMSDCSTPGSVGVGWMANCSFSHAWYPIERKIANVCVG